MISPESADEEVNGDLVPRLALACSEVVAVSKKGRWKTVFASSLHFFRWRFQIHIASNIRLLSKKHGGHQFLEDHVFVFVTLILFPKDPLHPPKSNIDTKNDPLENVSSGFKHGVVLGINSLDFRGVNISPLSPSPKKQNTKETP